jgi:hypothetical protein
MVSVVQDNIGYLPTIDAPATEMSTVNEILNQALKIMGQLSLQEITCVFDQALYAKAAEVVWREKIKFQSVVIRMVFFHTICNMMSIIGKRFQEAGRRDLAVECEIIAEGSITAVLEGRRYNRAVRLHKLVYEALLRVAWNTFCNWLEENHLVDLQSLDDTINQMDKLKEKITQKQLNEVMAHPSCARILVLFNRYLDFLRQENGDLSSFWMSYIDMVEVVLGLIRSSREGHWLLHLAMIREMIPWCFGYDKQNYARYLSVYYTQMTRLQIDHPQVYNDYQNGGFSVQIGSSNTFGRIPVDQTIEETANKDTQTPGGTKGFSLKKGAVSRYYLTAEHRSTCLRQLRQMVQVHTPGTAHADLEPARIKRDEKGVQSLTDTLENNWINPFAAQNDLACLSTGSVAPEDIREDLLSAKGKGEDAYTTFRKTRLEAEQPTQSFYDRLPKQQLKTFSNMKKSRKTKQSNKEIILKADHRLFGHMVLVAASRNLNMQEVLQHPLGSLPWALANCEWHHEENQQSNFGKECRENGHFS